MFDKTVKTDLQKLAKLSAPVDSGFLRSTIKVKGSKRNITLTYGAEYTKYLQEGTKNSVKHKGFIDKTTAEVIVYLENYYNEEKSSNRSKFKAKKLKNHGRVINRTKGKR